MICQREGETVEIDTRTSDAVALAVRFKCPIFTHEFILKEAGIILEEEEGAEKKPPLKKSPAAKKPTKGIEAFSIKELDNKLQEAIDKEDYEQASRIRDEINKRTNTNN